VRPVPVEQGKQANLSPLFICGRGITYIKLKSLLKSLLRKYGFQPAAKSVKNSFLTGSANLKTVDTDHHEIEKILPEIEFKLDGLEKEDLLRKVISLEFERLLGSYRNGEELIEQVSEKEVSSRKSFRTKQDFRSPGGKYTRLFINLGKSDGFYPEQLIDLVNTNTRGRKIPIGKIDLLKSFLLL